ncbi:MAG: hypothetical protein ACR2N0_00430 [Rubrobacteraceae bacterium]
MGRNRLDLAWPAHALRGREERSRHPRLESGHDAMSLPEGVPRRGGRGLSYYGEPLPGLALRKGLKGR